ncbi:DUF296 domain-containing protein [Actinoplanes sp. LDG1-06]|uniref:DUF296 domain-containing protein n=1 Tax=Paractinoplanes ovalisporus TaxID=2810368 RepID=A0ABS2A4C6_9ACTN|nr:DUF296 domain-containing protein [Actinoplanes ovalisporus]MBM2614698.1 DUF296 domain-containing protein [Actinoplanes ovalisporus]
MTTHPADSRTGAAPAPLVHPGPALPTRSISVPTRSTPVTLLLTPGETLVSAVSAAAARLGVEAAQVELLGGTLGEVAYCVPAECPDGSTAAWYSATRHARGPVNVIGGSATLGQRDGAVFMHTHAAWMDAAGVLQAGHLWPETTVGPVPVHAVIHPLPGVRSISATDTETHMPVFTPYAMGFAPAEGTRVVFSRVLPGENLRVAADRICAEAGFARASVRASLGSLVGPVFAEAGGTVLAGPCAEVMSLYGEAGPAVDPEAPMHALAVDRTGRLHGGVIDPARSPVAITAELLIIEQTPAVRRPAPDAPTPGQATPDGSTPAPQQATRHQPDPGRATPSQATASQATPDRAQADGTAPA